MVEVQDLLYWGSIMISIDKEGNLVGHSLVELENGYLPIALSDDFATHKHILHIGSPCRDK